jgi:hypothetical protein
MARAAGSGLRISSRPIDRKETSHAKGARPETARLSCHVTRFIAFSSEVGTGSREENASKQKI